MLLLLHIIFIDYKTTICVFFDCSPIAIVCVHVEATCLKWLANLGLNWSICTLQSAKFDVRIGHTNLNILAQPWTCVRFHS